MNIEISDDGAGIDVTKVKRKAVERGLLRPDAAEGLSDTEALRLIFEPGFSTAEGITHVSGHGVGLDVVKAQIENVGGVVDVMNRPGEGMTVRLTVPLIEHVDAGIPETLARLSAALGSGHGGLTAIRESCAGLHPGS